MRLAPVAAVLMAALLHVQVQPVSAGPMRGWMTWERYTCETDCDNFPETCISEELIRYAPAAPCWLPQRERLGRRLQPRFHIEYRVFEALFPPESAQQCRNLHHVRLTD